MKGRPIHELNRDYLDALAAAQRFRLDSEMQATLAAYERFIARNAHRIGPFPSAFREVALAEAKDNPVHNAVCQELTENTWKPGRPWFRKLFVPKTDFNPALVRTVDTGVDSLNAVCLIPSAEPTHLGVASDFDDVALFALGDGSCRWRRGLKSKGTTYLAIGGSESRLLCWRSTDGVDLFEIPSDTPRQINYPAGFSSNWWRAVSSDGCTAVFWRASIRPPQGPRPKGPVELMRFEHNRIKSIRKWQVPDLNFVGITPNGTTVVAVTDSCVTFLDCESSQETNVPRELPTETDFRVVTSTNDQGMISYGLGNWTARVYRAKATGLTQTYLWRAGSFVRGASLSDDGQLCAFGSRQGIVTVVDLQRIEQTRQLESHTSRVDLVALSADLSTAYSRTQDGTLLTWELSGGTCLGTQKGQQNFAGLQKPDAPPLILSGYDNQGARLVRTAGVHPGNPSAGCPAARLADPALLVTGGWDRAVRLWDVPSGRCLAVYPFDSRVSALAVSPRPPHIAVVGLWSGEVHFLDIQGI